MTEQMTVRELVAKAKLMMKEHDMVDTKQALTAIDFIIELLYLDIESTKRNYPHATSSIAEMEESIRKVINLQDIITEVEDNE